MSDSFMAIWQSEGRAVVSFTLEPGNPNSLQIDVALMPAFVDRQTPLGLLEHVATTASKCLSDYLEGGAK